MQIPCQNFINGQKKLINNIIPLYINKLRAFPVRMFCHPNDEYAPLKTALSSILLTIEYSIIFILLLFQWVTRIIAKFKFLNPFWKYETGIFSCRVLVPTEVPMQD